MCIYWDQLNDSQRSTLARILTDPADTDILWSNVLNLLKSFREVEALSIMNDKICIKYFDADHSYHIALISRPRGRKYIDHCQLTQIRELLHTMSETDPEED